ncbi:MAG: 30S ribosomal protein S9 [Patescibacteria group bacterium]|nr:30S ribosomal protein S9 [Patescibacteria group bacterium]
MTDKKTIKKNEKPIKEEKKVKITEKTDSKENVSKNKKLYIYAVGRRKSATAQVRIYKKGEGEITINKKKMRDYFKTTNLQNIIYAPFKLVGQGEKLKIWAKVIGGGKVGQAEAIRHGISRALLEINPNFRKPLRKQGFLTRDSRRKERKKPGLKRARRAPQWSKR